jgi:molybdate transport system substrate-binding protein
MRRYRCRSVRPLYPIRLRSFDRSIEELSLQSAVRYASRCLIADTEVIVRKRCAVLSISFALFFSFLEITMAKAAEIKIFTARAGQKVLEAIGPEFERATGHKLNVVYDDVIGAYLKRMNAGEPFDVIVSGTAFIDALLKDGKILADTRTNLFHSGMGVEVRAGAPKPDISTVEAFKRALLNAKSIGYIAPNRVQDLIERLGLKDAIRSKVTVPNSDIVSELVAKGETELGIVVITQIVTTPGVELVGPLPLDIQYQFQFASGISASSKAPAAARELLNFLTSPSAIRVIESQGMEPR